MPNRRERPSKTPDTTLWIAFLRGINVGGKAMIPMATLREVFEELGHTDVETYIQSGNVIFQPGAGKAIASADAVVARCEELIQKRFKLPVRVVVRTQRELKELEGVNPFPAECKADPSRVAVMFCSAKPKGTLDPKRSPRDTFTIVEREIFLSCPEGFANSKFTLDYVERTLGVTATARNWRTVTKLAAWGQES